MKERRFSAHFRPIQTGTALAITLAGIAHATDFYKANNTTNLNVSASWENLEGVAFVDPTKPTNTSTTSDTDSWTWDGRVLTDNTAALGNDLRVKTIRVLNPGGAVTIDGVTSNRSITVPNGGGIDMSTATQNLTINNLSTGTNVGLRLAASNAAFTIDVASGRTLTLNSKIAVAGGSGGATVNFTGAGTTVCNSQVQPTNVIVSAGEVQLNSATGSTRISNGPTTVNGGRLVINNTSGSATGSGAVTINGTATLTGQGIMTGALTVNSGGTLIPADKAVGTLTTGSLNLVTGSTIRWEATDPTSADLISVTNSDGLTLNGGTVELYNAGTTEPFTGVGTFNLFAYSGAIGGSGTASLSVAESSKIAGQTYTFGLAAGFVTLRIEVGSRPQSFWNVNANGNWSTPANWTSNGVPSAVSAIANLGGSQGIPTTAPRTVTLAAAATVGVLGFDSAQPFTLAGINTLNFDDGDAAATLHVKRGSHTVSAPVSLSPNGLLATVQDEASSLTLQGQITGDGGLGKSGAGTLILSADNFYTGLTSNSAGVLQLGAGSATGGVNGPIANNGTLRINRSEPATLVYQISGTGGIDLTGTGTITLAVTNTFSGPTTISAGTLEIGDPAALQNSTLAYLGTGGALTYMDGVNFIILGGLTGDKSLPLVNTVSGAPVSLTVGQNNQSTSYPASTTGGDSFTKAGSGTLSLTGSHLFTGNASIAGGVLSLDAGADFTSAALSTTAAGAKLRLNGGTLHTSVASVISNVSAGFEIISGTATFGGNIANPTNLDSGAFFINATGGTLNAGSMSISRGGLNLGATEPATGQTTSGLYINGGIVNIAGNLIIGNNANSSVSTRMDSGSLTVGGAVTLGISNLARWSVLDISGGTFTSTHAEIGVRLGGASDGNVVMHARGGVVSAERFQFGQADFAGSAILNLTAGSIFVGGGGMNLGSANPAFAAHFRLAGGVLCATADSSSTVPISLTGPAVVTGADASDAPHIVTFSGKVDGTGSLTKNGSGSVSFPSPDNAFPGAVNVTAGTLGLGGQSGAVTVAPGATLIPSGNLRPQAASTINGSLGIRYDVDNGLYPGAIRSEGVLTLGATSTLNISGVNALSGAVYVIASGTGGVSGTFGSVTGMPANYSLNYNYDNGSGTPVIALISSSASSFDSWAAKFGLSGAASRPHADPDNDGMQNLMEFGLGSNPTQSSSGPVLDRSGNFLTLTFNHIADPTLIFSIQAGDELSGPWTTVQTFPTFTSPGTATYTDNVAIGSTSHRFLRLSVTLAN